MKYGVAQPSGYREDGIYVPNPYYMERAINLGLEALEQGQHPLGAVVTRQWLLWSIKEGSEVVRERIAGTGINGTDRDSTHHAETEAIRKAEMWYGRYDLYESRAVLYTTHVPCPMCAGAIANSKLVGVVYGTDSEDAARAVEEWGIKWRDNEVSGLNVIRGRVEKGGVPVQFVIGGFMRDECYELLGMTALLGGENDSTS